MSGLSRDDRSSPPPSDTEGDAQGDAPGMASPLPGPPLACRFLRTKMAFGSHEPGAPDWQLGDDPTASYWCLLTMEPGGPDDGLVHAQACRRGRTCFEERDG